VKYYKVIQYSPVNGKYAGHVYHALPDNADIREITHYSDLVIDVTQEEYNEQPAFYQQ